MSQQICHWCDKDFEGPPFSYQLCDEFFEIWIKDVLEEEDEVSE